VTTWARSHEVVLVAPCFDRDAPANTLTVVDARGSASTYDKQHPARGMEPPRRERTPPGPRLVATRGGDIPLSTVICVDLDYGDLVDPVRSAGGILAAPSNDWFGGFERMHHRTAVWSAVLTGASTVRATGHGISAVYDGAGRVIAEESSSNGPVVLVVDAPLAAPRPGADRDVMDVVARPRLDGPISPHDPS
jgi:predicted amidohydrolase